MRAPQTRRIGQSWPTRAVCQSSREVRDFRQSPPESELLAMGISHRLRELYYARLALTILQIAHPSRFDAVTAWGRESSAVQIRDSFLTEIPRTTRRRPGRWESASVSRERGPNRSGKAPPPKLSGDLEIDRLHLTYRGSESVTNNDGYTRPIFRRNNPRMGK